MWKHGTWKVEVREIENMWQFGKLEFGNKELGRWNWNIRSRRHTGEFERGKQMEQAKTTDWMKKRRGTSLEKGMELDEEDKNVCE